MLLWCSWVFPAKCERARRRAHLHKEATEPCHTRIRRTHTPGSPGKGHVDLLPSTPSDRTELHPFFSPHSGAVRKCILLMRQFQKGAFALFVKSCKHINTSSTTLRKGRSLVPAAPPLSRISVSSRGVCWSRCQMNSSSSRIVVTLLNSSFIYKIWHRNGTCISVHKSQ